MSYDIVIFDIDGTLLDTREFVLASFEYAFISLGFAPPTREVLVPHIGRKLEDIYADFSGPDYADELTEIHRTFQGQNLHLSVPYPGVAETLEHLEVAGLKMAAVTSRSRRTSFLTLDRAEISRYFATVVSAEDTPNLKPAPDPLQAALKAISATPDAKVVMVGDTAHDIEAGRAIGAFTVAVTYGFHPENVLKSNPEATIADIAELPALLGIPG